MSFHSVLFHIALLCSLFAAPVTAMQSLHEVIHSRPEFSTLSTFMALLPDYELSKLLHQSGPYTFFLPRNEGFRDVDLMNYLTRLLTPTYRMHLFSLISYQITDRDVGEYAQKSMQNFLAGTDNISVEMETLVTDSVSVSSANGVSITLSSPLTSVSQITGTAIETSDDAHAYEASEILQPQWMKWDFMSVMENFDWTEVSDFYSGPIYTKFIHLLVAAGKDEELRSAKGLTLLAPGNEALSDYAMNIFLDPQYFEALTQFVEYHMIPQILNIQDLEHASENFITKQGEWIEVVSTDKGLKFNDSTLKGMHLCKHGVVYRLEMALLPPSWNV